MAQGHWVRDALRLRQVPTWWNLDRHLADLWSECTDRDRDRFDTVIGKLISREIDRCDDCDRPSIVITEINGNAVCDGCRRDNYTICVHCDTYASYDCVTHIDDDAVCEDCVTAHYFWCGDCEVYHTNDDGCDRACDCEASRLRFTFPNDGEPPIHQDERVTVTLPAGMIDPQGIRRIDHLVEQHGGPYWVIPEMDHRWQTREGNFTKRLCRAMYKVNGYKASPELVSTIGNIAREHSAGTSEYRVGVTRDLNQSAADFYHEDSCWWSSDNQYSCSRCAFKTMNGIGLRTWGDDRHSYLPTGRAWILPLDKTMHPTTDAMNAHAYMVFNGYGDLSGYVAARIVTHMVGMTYAKVEFHCSPMYVNGKTGYLVSDQETIDRYRECGVAIQATSHNVHRLHRNPAA